MKIDFENRDKLSSLLLLVFSGLVCVGSCRYSIGTLHKPGPGFFPFWGGVILGGLSFVNLLGVARKRKDVAEKAKPVKPERRWKINHGHGQALFSAGLDHVLQ